MGNYECNLQNQGNVLANKLEDELSTGSDSAVKRDSRELRGIGMIPETGAKPVQNPTLERDVIIRDLLLLAPHTEIVHHIRGRIRLRLKRSGLAVVKKTDIDRLMHNIPGIRNLRINPVVGSLILDYDDARIPFFMWEKLGEIRTKPELEPAVKMLLNDLWDRE